jgi:hypothetical protein
MCRTRRIRHVIHVTLGAFVKSLSSLCPPFIDSLHPSSLSQIAARSYGQRLQRERERVCVFSYSILQYNLSLVQLECWL